MIVIVASVCSILQASSPCKEIQLSYMEDNVTPQQCVKQGQLELSKWIESHPNWSVQRWGCKRIKDEKET